MIPLASGSGKGQRVPTPNCTMGEALCLPGSPTLVVRPGSPRLCRRPPDLVGRALHSADDLTAVHASVAAWRRPTHSPYAARSARHPRTAPPTAPAPPNPGGVNHSRPRQRAQRVRERLATGTAPTTPLRSGPPLQESRPRVPPRNRTPPPQPAPPGPQPRSPESTPPPGCAPGGGGVRETSRQLAPHSIPSYQHLSVEETVAFWVRARRSGLGRPTVPPSACRPANAITSGRWTSTSGAPYL